jgi:hypothetical protein
VAVGDNNSLSPIHRSSKKINKEILKLVHTIDQMDLANICRIFHSTSSEYTFFSAVHGTHAFYLNALKLRLNKKKTVKI